MTAEVLKNTLSDPGKICRDSLPSKKAYCTGLRFISFFLLRQILALAGQQVTNAGIATTQNNLTVNDAGIEEVRAQRDNAERELQRYRKLLEEDAVTRQEYDNVKTTRDVINARYEQVLRMKHSTSLAENQEAARRVSTDEEARIVPFQTVSVVPLGLEPRTP